MIAFLALDVLLERRDRPEEAKRLIETLRQVVDASSLDADEKNSLQSYLGGWRKTSLAAEIERFSSLGANAGNIVEGDPLPDFLSACLKLRNKLAHPPRDAATADIDEADLNRRTKGLRQVVLGIVWARNKLPEFSVYRPADTVRIEEMKLTFV